MALETTKTSNLQDQQIDIGGEDTQSASPDHNIRVSQTKSMLRMGHTRPVVSSVLGNQSDNSQVNKLTRTATDLQNLEHRVGYSSNHPNTHSEMADISARSTSLQNPEVSNPERQTSSRRMAMHQEPYREEWFRLLILLIYLLSTMTVISVTVATTGVALTRINILVTALQFAAGIVFITIVWTGSCVFAGVILSPAVDYLVARAPSYAGRIIRKSLRWGWYGWYLFMIFMGGFSYLTLSVL